MSISLVSYCILWEAGIVPLGLMVRDCRYWLHTYEAFAAWISWAWLRCLGRQHLGGYYTYLVHFYISTCVWYFL